MAVIGITPGQNDFCIRSCDGDGNCVTIPMVVTVTPIDPSTVFINMEPGQDSTVCVNELDFDLISGIATIEMLCEEELNDIADITFDAAERCLEITGSGG